MCQALEQELPRTISPNPPGGGAYDSPILLMRMEVPGWRGPNPGLCLICSTLCFCCQAARIRRVGLSRLVAELPCGTQVMLNLQVIRPGCQGPQRPQEHSSHPG